MKKIIILAMRNTIASTIIGPMDVFTQAGVLWNHFNGRPPAPRFEVKVVTATGHTPLAYLQHTRVEAAKLLLETDSLTFEEVTFRVGYEDSSTFRKIFKNSPAWAPRPTGNGSIDTSKQLTLLWDLILAPGKKGC